MSNSQIKEINKIISTLFSDEKQNSYVEYEWPSSRTSLISLYYKTNNIVTSSLENFISNKFKITKNKLRIYEFIVNDKLLEKPLQWYIIIQNNGKQNKPIFEFIKTKIPLTSLLNKINNTNDRNVLKRLRPEEIRDINDFKFYLTGVKKDYMDSLSELNRQKKIAKQKIAMYNIEAEDKDLVIENWLEQFKELGYNTKIEETNKDIDLFHSMFYVKDEYDIDEKVILFSLNKDNISVSGKWIFTKNYELVFDIMNVTGTFSNGLCFGIDNYMIEEYEYKELGIKPNSYPNSRYYELFNKLTRSNGEFNIVKEYLIYCENLINFITRINNEK